MSNPYRSSEPDPQVRAVNYQEAQAKKFNKSKTTKPKPQKALAGFDDLEDDEVPISETYKMGVEQDGNDDSKAPLCSYELYDKGIFFLNQKKIRLEPNIEGEYCFHDVYVLDEPIAENGFIPPKDFKCYKLAYGKSQFKRVIDAVKEMWSTDRPMYDYWLGLINPSADKKSSLCAMSKQLISVAGRQTTSEHNPVNENISLLGGSEALHWVPQTDWFSPEVQNLKIEDVLTLFPEAERKMFMLLMGRTMAGRSNTYSIEGTEIKHTFRAFGILSSLHAGVGKSTLMNYLINALNYCGYKVEIMQDVKSRFGWAKVAQSHLAYIDDLTSDSQKQLITNNKTKQLVSNGLMATERKGVDSVGVRSKATLIACSNNWNPRDFWDMDSGLKSRAHILYNYREPELAKQAKERGIDSSDLRTFEHWKHLSEKLGVSTRVLALWTLKLCTDYFLEVCGYEKRGVELEKSKPDTLEKVVKGLQKRYRIRTDASDCLNLLCFIKYMSVKVGYTIQHLDSNELILWLQFGMEVAHEEDYVERMKASYEAMDMPLWHPYIALRDIKWASTVSSTQAGKRNQDLGTPEIKIVDCVLGGVCTKSGFKIQSDYVWVQRYWDDASTYTDYFDELEIGLPDGVKFKPNGNGLEIFKN